MKVFNERTKYILKITHAFYNKVTLSNISIMQGTVNDWKKLLTTTRNMIALSSICQALPQDIALFRQLASCQKSSHLHHIANVVNRIINFEESKKAGRCVLNYGVDDDLDQCKNIKYFF